jgi:succinyl-diaminopimelate desuccinylase
MTGQPSDRLQDFLIDREIIELCRRLIQSRSINPPGNELEIALFAADYLSRAGLKAELVEHGEGRASVFATLKGSGGKPALLYSAHLDTVPVGAEQWQYDPFNGELEGGRIWGRGASDMKSGLAAIMAAAKALASTRLPLKGDLFLALTAGEEVGLLGAHHLVKRHEMERVGMIIVGEPSSNEVVIAEKGALWVELVTSGKTAHGSMPDCGRNALTMMLALLNEIEKMPLTCDVHPLLGVFTRSINSISAGVAINVVPDRCLATIDMRTVPGQDHKVILAQIEKSIDLLKERSPGFQATIRPLADYQPIAIEPDVVEVNAFMDVVSQVRGVQGKPKAVRYYSDAAVYVPVLKVPMVICGPGIAELAHQPNEYVETDKLVEAARIYSLFAARQLS